MGKKSPPPKPPDLTPISNAQIQMAQEANELAREQLGLSRQQFDWFMQHAQEEMALARQQADRTWGLQQRAQDSADEASAFARQVGQTQIDAMRQQMGYAAEDRQRYETVFRPLQDQYIAEAQAYDTPARREAEAARQMADVQRASEAQRANADARLRSMGVDPSQVRSTSMANQMGVATAANQALTGNMARQQVEDRGRSMREAAINLGNGLPAQSAMNFGGATASGNSAVGAGMAGQNAVLNGLNGSANLGAMGLSYRQNALAQAGQLTGTPTAWAGIGGNSMGMAGNFYNNAGNTINQGYQNQMAQWNAGQQQAQQNFSNIMGIGSMAAGMFMAEGGAVPRGGAGPEDLTPIDMFDTGAPQGGAIMGNKPDWKARLRERMRENAIDFKHAAPGQSLSMSDRVGNAMKAGERWSEIQSKREPAKAVMPENVLSYQYSAEGGRAIPRKQSRDRIPAMLSEGEYVFPADVVSAIGLEKLDKMVAKYHRSNA